MRFGSRFATIKRSCAFSAMQEASSCSNHVGLFVAANMPRKVIHSFAYDTVFAIWLLCLTLYSNANQGATPLVLLALLLLAVPLLLTLQKLLLLPELGERNGNYQHITYYSDDNFLSLEIIPFKSLRSLRISSPQ